MMLEELEALLEGCARDAAYEDYASAIVDDNLLRKKTLATRQKTLRHLRELYALRDSVPLFASMRSLWWEDPASRPLLALSCAAARDPLVRCSIETIEATPVGGVLASEDFSAAVQGAFPGRFSRGVGDRIGRNLASTWTQSGHLLAGGRTGPKVRVRIKTPTMAGVYALYLGHLDGKGGPALFATPWTAMLDADAGLMRGLAEEGARRGWLEYASSGGMTEIGFNHLDDLVRPKNR